MESRDTSVERTIEWWVAQARASRARAGSPPGAHARLVDDLVPPHPPVGEQEE